VSLLDILRALDIDASKDDNLFNNIFDSEYYNAIDDFEEKLQKSISEVNVSVDNKEKIKKNKKEKKD